MKKAVWIVAIVIAAAVGFFVRGLLPSGGPPPGMMGMGAMPPPAVTAVELREEPLDVLEEYIAAIEPVQEVMIKTEVSGYIDAVHFKEGSMVKQGDLLFTIDQQSYQAMIAVREAELARTEAELKRSEQFLVRMREASARSISQSDLDTAESNHLQAVAAQKQAEANLNLARIDLAYSEIRAPIRGRIGAAMLTKGNYVDSMSGSTLARIVQTSPIRAVFSMTDRAWLDLRSQEINGSANGLVAHIRMVNGARLPGIGKKDFDSNVMSSETGTIAVRYLFDNPDGLLVPGGYVNILLGQPEPPVGIRVPRKSVLMDPRGSYVLTVNADGLVGAARVELGHPIEADVVVQSGLKAGDRVVFEGVQKVQPGMTAAVSLQEAVQ